MRLLDRVTANTTGPWIRVPPGNQNGQLASRTIQAIITGTGTVVGNIAIQVCNDLNIANGVPITAATIALNGAAPATDGFAGLAQWTYIRAVLSGLTGTGATCTVTMGT